MSELLSPILSEPGSSFWSSGVLFVLGMLALRSILRTHKMQMEQVSAKDESRRRSADSSDPIRVLQRISDELEGLFERVARQHQLIVGTARAVSMVGLILIIVAMALSGVDGLQFLRTLLLIAGLISMALALTVGLQGKGLSEHQTKLLEKIVASQYMHLTMSNAQALEGERREAEIDRINNHLRLLIDTLHDPHQGGTPFIERPPTANTTVNPTSNAGA